MTEAWAGLSDLRFEWSCRTMPQFEDSLVDVVGLYLDSPENAIVLSVTGELTKWHGT